MQLYFPDQIPGTIQGRVCRHSRLMAVVGVALMFLFLAAMPTFLIWKLKPSLWISGPALLFAGLILKWLAGIAIKACRATNWLMRIAPDGLWINLRSYLNRDFDSAATVLFVPYGDIASVRQYTVKRSERNQGGIDRLDRSLFGGPAGRPGAGRGCRGNFRRATPLQAKQAPGRLGHVAQLATTMCPSRCREDDVLRLAWLTRFDFITPSTEEGAPRAGRPVHGRRRRGE